MLAFSNFPSLINIDDVHIYYGNMRLATIVLGDDIYSVDIRWLIGEITK